jgi:hypothetical protein
MSTVFTQLFPALNDRTGRTARAPQVYGSRKGANGQAGDGEGVRDRDAHAALTHRINHAIAKARQPPDRMDPRGRRSRSAVRKTESDPAWPLIMSSPLRLSPHGRHGP